MVLKSPSVLWCLLPARLARRTDSEKHQNDLSARHQPEPELDRPSRDWQTDPQDLPDPLIPDGGIGESPVPPNRAVSPPVRPKRSSFTTFFAFSSKRKPAHETPVVHLKSDLLVPVQSVPGKWVPGRGQSQVHLIDSSSIPSPLRADDDEYYYSYSPAFRSYPTSPIPDSPSKRLSPRKQKPVGGSDMNSQPSSTVDSHPPRPFVHHPYAYSTHLDPKSSVSTIPHLRHATSQPFQLQPHSSRSDIHARPRLPRRGHDSEPHLLQPHLKTSLSTPNLASGTPLLRPRSLTGRRHPARPKERWLSAETWWDALFSPSPRLKVKQPPLPHIDIATGGNPDESVRAPVQTEPRTRNLGPPFPSAPVLRPRAISIASVASNARSTPHLLSRRSRSAADIHGQASLMATPRAAFEPALEPLADDPTPTPDQLPTVPPPDPPLSLEQVIDEGEAFEQQRAQWKKQATRSIGNKHTRSVSRARSKSLSERQARGHHSSEGSKAQFSLEFLAARTLLGSQSTMPTVHVTRPSNSSSYSKAHSHSHSHSAYSYTHTSNSHGYSHSHSHSLTTSNSSKSSRHLPPRGHSRADSWSKTAFLKAGSLCGILQDESYTVPVDEKIPSSPRVDVQTTDLPGNASGDMGALDTAKTHLPPCITGNQVGIAITSSSTPEASIGVASLRYQERDKRSSKQKRQSFEYAGPHPSVIDSNLPQLGVASNVSLRHRLPPRAGIHPPIAPIAHPYRSASAPLMSLVDRIGVGSTPKVTTNQAATEESTGSASRPHISLSHADFEQYGVGEALVYASPSPLEKDSGSEPAAAESGSLPSAELPPSQEQSPSRETVPGPDTLSSGIDNPPSLTSSTIQMVMSAFDNPDDLDEFQDLFYRPHPASQDQDREPSITINTDVRNSASNSPLIHLVRKLSEEVHGRRDPSRTPSDSICIRRSELQRYPSNESGSKFVFTNVARSSSSQESSQSHISIEDGSEATTQSIKIIPEDVDSSCTASVPESPWAEHENDTFGYPIRHGQLEATTPPSPIQSPFRVSTHLSIQENHAEEDDSAFLRPGRTRFESSSADLARSSYLTTSDMSRMSGLLDFPLPPTAQPSGHVSILRTSSEPTTSSESRSHGEQEDEGGMEQPVGDEESADPSGDVGETLRVLRTMPRVTSYDSRRTTFGGSEDMDFITQLHQSHS